MPADNPEPGLSYRPSTDDVRPSMEEVRPSIEEVLKARRRLTASSTFGRSRRLIRLLEFTIDAAIGGRADEIKESTIGSEVYARGPDFDPRADGIVRVEANRLRQKLAEYYQGAGQGDPIRIDYPKGAYIPEFRYSTPTVEPAQPIDPPTDLARPRQNHWKILAGLAAVACVATASILFVMRRGPAPFVRPGVVVLSPVNLSGKTEN